MTFKENEFVEIKNVFCVPGEEEGNFKLLCHFFEDQVQVLRQEISSAKAIVRRLENLPHPNQVCLIISNMATQISMTFLEDMKFNATVAVSSSFFFAPERPIFS